MRGSVSEEQLSAFLHLKKAMERGDEVHIEYRVPTAKVQGESNGRQVGRVRADIMYETDGEQLNLKDGFATGWIFLEGEWWWEDPGMEMGC